MPQEQGWLPARELPMVSRRGFPYLESASQDWETDRGSLMGKWDAGTEDAAARPQRAAVEGKEKEEEPYPSTPARGRSSAGAVRKLMKQCTQ